MYLLVPGVGLAVVLTAASMGGFGDRPSSALPAVPVTSSAAHVSLPTGNAVVTVPHAGLGRTAGLPETLAPGGRVAFSVPIWVAGGEAYPRLSTKSRADTLRCVAPSGLSAGGVTDVNCVLAVSDRARVGSRLGLQIRVHAGQRTTVLALPEVRVSTSGTPDRGSHTMFEADVGLTQSR